MATLSSAKSKYVAKIKIAVDQDKYADGMARFLGVSKSQIAGSGPVVSWRNEFKDDAARRAKADAWEAGLKAAFGLT